MNSLMLYRPDHAALHLETTIDGLSKSPWFHQIKAGPEKGTSVRLEFIVKGLPVMAYSNEAGDALFIDVCSDESIQTMLEIGRAYDDNLRLCDTAYTFDIQLTADSTFEDVVDGMAVGRFDS